MFVPPHDADWLLVSYQPMLYLASFVGTLIVLVAGDFTNIQHSGIDEDRTYGLFWIWGSLSLLAPPMALGALWIIQHREGKARYRGLWLRLAADVFQFIALTIYLVFRLAVGDYHVLPVAILCSAVLFVAHLVGRDVRRLVEVEQLAIRLHRDSHDAR